jgi:antitoxin component YwqK of YwqJK toxin-antitoxin module
MSETSAQPKPRRRRRWLQFSLRSMLLLTTLASVCMWWYLRPGPLERLLPDGMKLRVPVVVIENEKTKGNVSKNHGPLVVLDRHGRTLAKGYYDNDQPAGYWTYYHLDGRKALAGPCVEGCRTGAWTAWDESGRKRAEVEHGEPGHAFMGEWLGKSVGMGGEMSKVAAREGPARQWWDNGQSRTEGNFQQDQGHGPWVFWNRDGMKVAAGQLRHGVRHGKWTITNEKSSQSREVQYVHGRETPKIESLLAELEVQLQSDQWHVRHDAVTALGLLGSDGVPLLAKTLKANDTLEKGTATERYLALAIVVRMLEKVEAYSYNADDLTLKLAIQALLERAMQNSDARVADAAKRIYEYPPVRRPASNAMWSLIPVVG